MLNSNKTVVTFVKIVVTFVFAIVDNVFADNYNTLMKYRTAVKKFIRIMLAVFALICCACLFCGCHVFAWYIPKQYSEEEKAEIYGFIRDELLTDADNYIASVSIQADGIGVASYGYYNVFVSEGKLIINMSKYPQSGSPTYYAVWYNGTLKEWDVAARQETVTDNVSVEEYRFLFDYIAQYADFLKTRVVGVASYRFDSYFHECFPWGMGMAQMYYDDIDGMSVTGSWTVEKYKLVNDEGLPLVFNADFTLSTQNESISLDVYGSPYGIDERITNILSRYEEEKERLPVIEDINVYLTVNNEKMSLLLYDNETTRALAERLRQGDVTCTVDDYGGFEKVGSIGFPLPMDDEPLTTGVGDVMLYQGDKIVLFYGSNTCNYTRLGFIVGYSPELITDILRYTDGAVQITLSLEEL